VADIDVALAAHPPLPETARSVTVTDRKCKRHDWIVFASWNPDVPEAPEMCRKCGIVKDEQRSRRGRSARRLGNDQERRAERRYGWEKIGERGEKTDLRGRFAKVQQKSTRHPVPVLFRNVFAGLDATKDGRVPLLLLSYVRQGFPTEDYIVMRGETWLELHGVDEPETVK
jgi:hypothetical protein